MISLKSLIFAVQFLTIIPIKKGIEAEEKIFSDSAVFFPVVGLMLGAVLVLTSKLLGDFVSPALLSIIIVLMLILLSGALHLDGLADTVDGFYAGRDRISILRIMRDSMIGTMGVTGIVGIILLKVGFLASMEEMAGILLLMPALSRWSMSLSIFAFNYAREEGKAKYFFEGFTFNKFAAATLLMLIIAYACFELAGIILVMVIALNTLLFGWLVKQKINGQTGDTLGAVCEINEVLILILGFIGSRVLL